MGVSVVGHRRALLNANADLRSDTNATQAPSAAFETGTAPAKDTAAERRQVTVMFSDLVGSTALSARMDPEDLREVISAYQKCVAETVRRFGGFVAKYMGDGVLWLLGYPEAALRDADDALKNARETGQAASLMFALHFPAVPLILCGNYSRATALAQELCALADEKDLPFWRVN